MTLNRYRQLSFASLLPRAAAVVLCLCGASCSQGADLPPLPSAQATSYQLAANDVVHIVTFGQDQLSGQFEVNSAGNIELPLLGSVPANGDTTGQLEHSIEQRLAQKKILHDPNVSVNVIKYRPIFILGEVTKPGEYTYQPGMTVLTAVAVAGGFTYRAVKDRASIVRIEDGHPAEGRALRDTLVEPGDVINIYERYF